MSKHYLDMLISGALEAIMAHLVYIIHFLGISKYLSKYLLTAHGGMQYFSSVFTTDWMGYSTSWASQFEISNSHLARALFRAFIRIFTTVVTNS